MFEYTIAIDGMMCEHCEAHINDAIKKNFKIKKVSSSFKEGQTLVLSKAKIDENKVKTVVEDTGYEFKSISCREV